MNCCGQRDSTERESLPHSTKEHEGPRRSRSIRVSGKSNRQDAANQSLLLVKYFQRQGWEYVKYTGRMSGRKAGSKPAFQCAGTNNVLFSFAQNGRHHSRTTLSMEHCNDQQWTFVGGHMRSDRRLQARSAVDARSEQVLGDPFPEITEFRKCIPDFSFDAISCFDIILGDESPDLEDIAGHSGFMTLLQKFSFAALDMLSKLVRRQFFHASALELIVAPV